MPKRILQGVVTSDANQQTVTVSVERRFKHPVMQKTIRKSKVLDPGKSPLYKKDAKNIALPGMRKLQFARVPRFLRCLRIGLPVLHAHGQTHALLQGQQELRTEMRKSPVSKMDAYKADAKRKKVTLAELTYP